MTVNVSDWSETPSSNGTVDGTNIAENCPAANINGAIRSVMAGVKTMYLGLPNLATYLKRDGSEATTGDLKRDGRGAYLHHASSANASGRLFSQASGGSIPSGMADGDFLVEYA